MSLIEIKCPLCKGTLWVDLSSGTVVDHKSGDKPKADFSEFLEAQKNYTPAWDEKFNKIKEEKAKRKAEIEEKFKKAKDLPDDENNEFESPFKWD